MIDLTNARAIMIPEGSVTKITDSLNRVLWEASIDYSEPFWIEALDSGVLEFEQVGDNAPDFTLYWSWDKETWEEGKISDGLQIPVDFGDKIWFMTSFEGGQGCWSDSGSNYVHFVSDFNFNIGGNIMSLIEPTFDIYYDTIEETYGLSKVFMNSRVVDASELLLPATNLSSYCYKEMFRGCSRLTTLPVLPASSLSQGCYYQMFQGCSSLIQVSSNLLPATTLAPSCYSHIFWDCYNLTTAPDLLAPTLVELCYQRMFGQTKVVSVKCLAISISASNATELWFNGVTNDSNHTFIKATGVEWPRSASGIPDQWTVQTI